MVAPKPTYTYRIRVEGRVAPEWQDWFGGLEVIPSGAETLLIGSLPDNAALQGVLVHLANLNLGLISVERSLPIEKE
jgi:hypothetical protein